MSGDERGDRASRLAALRETAVVAGLALAALRVIPSQTASSGPVLGLQPGLLPTVCVAVIAIVALIALALRLWRPEPLLPQRSAPIWPAAMLAAVAGAGVLALQLLGPVACGVVVVALGLAVLRERRMAIVLPTLAGTALVLAAVFQVWR
jgi:nucleoside recognition membrane protein YjiH